MKWFGTYWGASICNETPHVVTPVGKLCAWCGEPLVEGDQGVCIDNISERQGVEVNEQPHHRDCFLRSICGSVGHQLKRCSCYGGTEDDPVGMTKREAATAAANLMRFCSTPVVAKRLSTE